jgi:hypothetical protein
MNILFFLHIGLNKVGEMNSVECTLLKPVCPVRIRDRIDLSYLLVCCKRRLNKAILRIRRKKTRLRFTAGVKDPSLLKGPERRT